MALVLALLALLALLTDWELPQYELRLAEPRLELDRQVAATFASVVTAQTDFDITLVPHTDADMPSIESLRTGEADIALVSNNEPFVPDVMTIMPLYANVLYVLVAEEADRVIAGDIFAGPPGSPSRVLFERYLDEIPAQKGDIRFVDQFSERCPNLIIIFAPVVRGLESRVGECQGEKNYRLGGRPPEDQAQDFSVDAVVLLNPSLRKFVFPVGAYTGFMPPGEAVETVAVDKLLVANSDVPASVIYDLMGQIVRLRPALAAAEPTDRKSVV